MRKVLWMAVAAGVVFGMANLAVAEDDYTLQRLKREFRSLREEVRVLKAEKMDTRLSAAQRDEIIKLCAELNKDAATRGSMPSWAENFTIFGDLRLRWQSNCYNGEANTKERHRSRIRLRVGAKKTWWDKQLEVGFRLASGADDDGTSTNQTMDNHWSEFQDFGIDQAYAKYQPASIPGLTLIGGKFGFKKLWIHTSMMFDSDLNAEGAWMQYKTKMGSFSPFASAGYFWLEEESRGPDVSMWMGQVGFDWAIASGVTWTTALSYYDYNSLEENWGDDDGNNQAGGLLLAEEFDILNFTTKLKFKLGGIPFAGYFDWAHNCGDTDNTADFDDQSDAYAAGIKVGTNKKKGDWSFGYEYKYIEANAVVGMFADSDFGRANRKGHVLKAKYNIDKFLTLGAALFYTEPVTGGRQDQTNTTVQIDLVWKF